MRQHDALSHAIHIGLSNPCCRRHRFGGREGGREFWGGRSGLLLLSNLKLVWGLRRREGAVTSPPNSLLVWGLPLPLPSSSGSFFVVFVVFVMFSCFFREREEGVWCVCVCVRVVVVVVCGEGGGPLLPSSPNPNSSAASSSNPPLSIHELHGRHRHFRDHTTLHRHNLLPMRIRLLEPPPPRSPARGGHERSTLDGVPSH